MPRSRPRVRVPSIALFYACETGLSYRQPRFFFDLPAAKYAAVRLSACFPSVCWQFARCLPAVNWSNILFIYICGHFFQGLFLGNHDIIRHFLYLVFIFFAGPSLPPQVFLSPVLKNGHNSTKRKNVDTFSSKKCVHIFQISAFVTSSLPAAGFPGFRGFQAFRRPASRVSGYNFPAPGGSGLSDHSSSAAFLAT